MQYSLFTQGQDIADEGGVRYSVLGPSKACKRSALIHDLKGLILGKPSFMYHYTSSTLTSFILDREITQSLSIAQRSSLDLDFFFFLPFFFGGGGGGSTSSAVLTCGAPSMLTFGFSILRHKLSG